MAAPPARPEAATTAPPPPPSATHAPVGVPATLSPPAVPPQPPAAGYDHGPRGRGDSGERATAAVPRRSLGQGTPGAGADAGVIVDPSVLAFLGGFARRFQAARGADAAGAAAALRQLCDARGFEGGDDGEDEDEDEDEEDNDGSDARASDDDDGGDRDRVRRSTDDNSGSGPLVLAAGAAVAALVHGPGDAAGNGAALPPVASGADDHGSVSERSYDSSSSSVIPHRWSRESRREASLRQLHAAKRPFVVRLLLESPEPVADVLAVLAALGTDRSSATVARWLLTAAMLFMSGGKQLSPSELELAHAVRVRLADVTTRIPFDSVFGLAADDDTAARVPSAGELASVTAVTAHTRLRALRGCASLDAFRRAQQAAGVPRAQADAALIEYGDAIKQLIITGHKLFQLVVSHGLLDIDEEDEEGDDDRDSDSDDSSGGGHDAHRGDADGGSPRGGAVESDVAHAAQSKSRPVETAPGVVPLAVPAAARGHSGGARAGDADDGGHNGGASGGSVSGTDTSLAHGGGPRRSSGADAAAIVDANSVQSTPRGLGGLGLALDELVTIPITGAKMKTAFVRTVRDAMQRYGAVKVDLPRPGAFPKYTGSPLTWERLAFMLCADVVASTPEYCVMGNMRASEKRFAVELCSQVLTTLAHGGVGGHSAGRPVAEGSDSVGAGAAASAGDGDDGGTTALSAPGVSEDSFRDELKRRLGFVPWKRLCGMLGFSSPGAVGFPALLLEVTQTGAAYGWGAAGNGSRSGDGNDMLGDAMHAPGGGPEHDRGGDATATGASREVNRVAGPVDPSLVGVPGSTVDMQPKARSAAADVVSRSPSPPRGPASSPESGGGDAASSDLAAASLSGASAGAALPVPVLDQLAVVVRGLRSSLPGKATSEVLEQVVLRAGVPDSDIDATAAYIAVRKAAVVATLCALPDTLGWVLATLPHLRHEVSQIVTPWLLTASSLVSQPIAEHHRVAGTFVMSGPWLTAEQRVGLAAIMNQEQPTAVLEQAVEMARAFRDSGSGSFDADEAASGLSAGALAAHAAAAGAAVDDGAVDDDDDDDSVELRRHRRHGRHRRGARGADVLSSMIGVVGQYGSPALLKHILSATGLPAAEQATVLARHSDSIEALLLQGADVMARLNEHLGVSGAAPDTSDRTSLDLSIVTPPVSSNTGAGGPAASVGAVSPAATVSTHASSTLEGRASVEDMPAGTRVARLGSKRAGRTGVVEKAEGRFVYVRWDDKPDVATLGPILPTKLQVLALPPQDMTVDAALPPLVPVAARSASGATVTSGTTAPAAIPAAERGASGDSRAMLIAALRQALQRASAPLQLVSLGFHVLRVVGREHYSLAVRCVADGADAIVPTAADGTSVAAEKATLRRFIASFCAAFAECDGVWVRSTEAAGLVATAAGAGPSGDIGGGGSRGSEVTSLAAPDHSRGLSSGSAASRDTHTSASTVTSSSRSSSLSVGGVGTRKDRQRLYMFKSTLCKHWLRDGTCPFAERCRYAHGDEELAMYREGSLTGLMAGRPTVGVAGAGASEGDTGGQQGGDGDGDGAALDAALAGAAAAAGAVAAAGAAGASTAPPSGKAALGAGGGESGVALRDAGSTAGGIAAVSSAADDPAPTRAAAPDAGAGDSVAAAADAAGAAISPAKHGPSGADLSVTHGSSVAGSESEGRGSRHVAAGGVGDFSDGKGPDATAVGGAAHGGSSDDGNGDATPSSSAPVLATAPAASQGAAAAAPAAPAAPAGRSATRDAGDVDVETKYSYTLGEEVLFEEDLTHEFKRSVVIDELLKYVIAFLNTRGGTLYGGIEDRGIVCGLHVDREARDQLRLAIDRMLRGGIKPPVHGDMVEVAFVPVAGAAQPETFVVEIKVIVLARDELLNRAFVSKRGNVLYYRRQASVETIDTFAGLLDWYDHQRAMAQEWRKKREKTLEEQMREISETVTKLAMDTPRASMYGGLGRRGVRRRMVGFGSAGITAGAGARGKGKGRDSDGGAGVDQSGMMALSVMGGMGGGKSFAPPLKLGVGTDMSGKPVAERPGLGVTGAGSSSAVAVASAHATPVARPVAADSRLVQRPPGTAKWVEVKVKFASGIRIGMRGTVGACDFHVALQQVYGSQGCRVMLVVTEVTPGGQLWLDGRVGVGAHVLKVNGKSVVGQHGERITKLLSSCKEMVFRTANAQTPSRTLAAPAPEPIPITAAAAAAAALVAGVGDVPGAGDDVAGRSEPAAPAPELGSATTGGGASGAGAVAGAAPASAVSLSSGPAAPSPPAAAAATSGTRTARTRTSIDELDSSDSDVEAATVAAAAAAAQTAAAAAAAGNVGFLGRVFGGRK